MYNTDNLILEASLKLGIKDSKILSLIKNTTKIDKLKDLAVKKLKNNKIEEVANISKRLHIDKINIDSIVSKFGKNYHEHKNFFTLHFNKKYNLPSSIASIMAIPFSFVCAISKEDKRERNKIIGQLDSNYKKLPIKELSTEQIDIILTIVGFLLRFIFTYNIVTAIPYVALGGVAFQTFLIVICFVVITNIWTALKKDFQEDLNR